MLSNQCRSAYENIKCCKDYKSRFSIILGDRYEAFVSAQCCCILQVPIAHLHGGEITEGAVDDVFRHSITKMSQIHFVASEEYRKRVIQLGENPNEVYNVGSLGVEGLVEFMDNNCVRGANWKKDFLLLRIIRKHIPFLILQYRLKIF